MDSHLILAIPPLLAAVLLMIMVRMSLDEKGQHTWASAIFALAAIAMVVLGAVAPFIRK